MNILFVSHFYPPVHDGGYAQLCADVAEGLKKKGHTIHVLTNRPQDPRQEREEHIYRLLFLENDLLHFSPAHFFGRWLWEERCNSRIIASILNKLNPDIVFIWGMYGLSRSIPAAIESRKRRRVAYYISDMWPASPSFVESYWKDPAQSSRKRKLKSGAAFIARLLTTLRGYPPKLAFTNSLIVSDAIRQNLCAAGLPFQDSEVIYSGTDPTEFIVERDYICLANPDTQARVLYAGNVIREKGVHTAIEALSRLRPEFDGARVTLTIAGRSESNYEATLRDYIARNNLSDQITFVGYVPRRQMPQLLRDHDILLVPSICEDALPRIVQEGMFAGMAIIGSKSGGIPEMVLHEQTGLTFSPGDPVELALQLRRLLKERQLACALAPTGQKFARERFSLNRMVEQIHDFLICRFTNV